jgi:5'-deoxynucleotidase YfbR-like HD superfamily hydrolase
VALGYFRELLPGARACSKRFSMNGGSYVWDWDAQNQRHGKITGPNRASGGNVFDKFYSDYQRAPTGGLVHQLLFILHGGSTLRFHQVPIIHPNRDGQHQWGVAQLCYLIAPAPSLNLIMAALCHDMAEQTVGDVPSPTKRMLRMSSVLEKIENNILEQNGYLFPLTPEEDRVLALADRLEGCLTCIYERGLGNKFVKVVYERFRSYIATVELTPAGASVLRALEELWQEVDGGNPEEIKLTYGR